jgi:exopolyphosphatase/guanosine-5'-triphosphate,3'-diphosphate pyrophosphatase
LNTQEKAIRRTPDGAGHWRAGLRMPWRVDATETMPGYPTIAAVDLGSNSFRLQIAKVVDDRIYPLDALSDKVRLAGGLTPDKYLDEASQERALECLRRFAERIRGLHRQAVRAVGTNSLRVAKNAAQFVRRAELALGFPIEVVAGREEARLIYLGVVHSLPTSNEKRLVADIGGGSTEFIIGTGFEPSKLESLYMGCVSHSLRFFPSGKITKNSLAKAELAARGELEVIASEFSAGNWQQAIGSSGTARALADILQLNGWGNGDITPKGLDQLRTCLLKAGDINSISLPGLRADRVPVLLGGFAIMAAIFAELKVKRMTIATGAMREGILYDLVGRFHQRDMRDGTVQHFMQRYHVDIAQAERVERLAVDLLRQMTDDAAFEVEEQILMLRWAARLHEVGLAIAHSGFHKHSAYIIRNADMPGFSRMEQEHLGRLVLGHRGGLRKMQGLLDVPERVMPALALRLAALFYRSRAGVTPPDIRLAVAGSKVEIALSESWLAEHPLTAAALETEAIEWKGLGVKLTVVPTGERAPAAAAAVG